MGIRMKEIDWFRSVHDAVGTVVYTQVKRPGQKVPQLCYIKSVSPNKFSEFHGMATVTADDNGNEFDFVMSYPQDTLVIKRRIEE